MGRSTVQIILVVLVVVLAIWDIYLAADDVEDNTISAIISRAASRSTALAFGAGFLCGHWFW